MKITAIETLRPSHPATLIFVRLHTDEGLVGLGETWFGPETVEADIHARLAPALLGADSSRINDLARQMKPYAGAWGTGAEMRALSAVEIALWDLAGKRAGMPVCDLLGGRCRADIPVYNTCAGPDYVSKSSDVRPDNFGEAAGEYEDLTAFTERPVELAQSLCEMGIASMKIWPFDFAAGASDGMDISAADLRRAVAPFEAIRAALGDRMALKAELHGLWSLPAARKICRVLEPIGVDWVEDPVWMDRPDLLTELAATTTCPLAGGETLGGLGQMRTLIECGGVAYPILDIAWGGGIGFARDAAAIAHGAGRPVAFHDCSGPVTLAVSTHLALACPNVREQEITRAFYFKTYPRLVDGLPPLQGGRLSVNQTPGHGISVIQEIVQDPGTIRRVSALQG
ncbi:mandelate racemase/muconate lactonizing enzyme family protein [Rhodobacteraceae bacterium NNCM2]|nr:mandelate racemase/muconate lactonizing enzyme family protein [Coraliihabitans acroporae]